MRHHIASFIICVLLIWPTAMAEANTSKPSYAELEQAYYQRQYSVLASQLNMFDPADVNIELLTVALAVATDQKDKEPQLEALTVRHPDNARVRFMAGKLWYQIKQQSSLFNKLALVEKSNENYLMAAKLAPDNPQYLIEAAKALAIQSGFFDAEKQASKAMVEKLAQLDQRSYYLALMDYWQNTQNAAAAKQTIATIKADFPQDMALLNRAANLLWTFAEKSQAQQLFVASCKLTAPSAEQLPLWQDACLSAADLALQNYGDKQQALAALNVLLSTDKVTDEQYVGYLMLHAELNLALADLATALQSYQQALALTTQDSTRKDIRRQLSKLTK